MDDNKLIAVLNDSIDMTQLHYALSRMALGLGASLGQEPLRLSTYIDADQGEHPYISSLPFDVLFATSTQIRQLRAEAIASVIAFADFTHTMLGNSSMDQLARTKSTKESELIYYGIILFADTTTLHKLTANCYSRA